MYVVSGEPRTNWAKRDSFYHAGDVAAEAKKVAITDQ